MIQNQLKINDPNPRLRQTDVVRGYFRKPFLRFFAVLFIKFLQKRYKTLSISRRGQQSNRLLSQLILIQSILYFLKSQFSAWGYFHPSCVLSKEDEIYFRNLFPQKDFLELDIVVWYNPEAVTYYQNKIYTLSKNCPPCYEIDIKNQLIKWKNWN